MSSFSPNQLRQCARFTGTPCTPDKEQQLREQIHSELTKIKYCANPTYECSLMRIEGYEYCIRHILRDPRSNYRQCSHVYSNGRKCINAVAKFDNKKEQILTTLCFEHNRQTQLQKTHLNVGRIRSRVETNETLLHGLSSHINVEDIKPEVPKAEPDDDEIDVVSPHVIPFVPQDHRNSIRHVVESSRKRRRILDYASDSSSNDEDPPCLKNTAQDIEFYESDYESIDSEDDDPLKHAGVFTRAEAVRIAETKLIKLQGLYREQLSHLQNVLKQRRRKYLHDIRREREIYCSIHDQLKDTPHERKLYEQLKALNSYHRRQGMEAVLYKKLKEKRARDTLYASKSSSNPKCVFTEGGVKCGERTLPCCKHCRKHILEDKRQVLFRACGVERSGVVCQEPVASILEDSNCVLHLTVAPAKRQYIQKFYELPKTPPVESIFAAGRGVDNFVEEDPPVISQTEGDDLLDLASGIFEFDLETADELANSLDGDCTMFLDMESDLGLAINDHTVDIGNLDLGLQEEIEGVSSYSVDPVETLTQDNFIDGHLDLDESSVQDSNELNFNIDDSESNINEVLRMLEGIEQMPWFDALMN
ncbi:KAT8 regulatory NSL complex subunit 2 isoform X2 [Drosophila eugracilis]|uniref:KAT8 regulatory NSL complex subunit 2 isoform X2 n=1 Tax=Drosophila eugracilis TaxID=29029 RepID=UPI0007E793F4|nr:KAT8 regulatory NSL complex subunit 2 isoform X2 [Drosophila eugracilis]